MPTKITKRFSKKALFCLSLAILSLIFSFGIRIVLAAWTDPTENPPDGDIAAPLNVSAANQTKTGGLNIGGVLNITTAGDLNFVCTTCVGTGDLLNNAVTRPKIANDAVNSNKIADGTIATVDLADNSVTSAKIMDNSVGASELNSNQCNNDQIWKKNSGSWGCGKDEQGLTSCNNCQSVFVDERGTEMGMTGVKEMHKTPSQGESTHFTVSTSDPGKDKFEEAANYAIYGNNETSGIKQYGVYGRVTSNNSFGLVGLATSGNNSYGAVGCYNTDNCGYLGGSIYAGYFKGSILAVGNITSNGKLQTTTGDIVSGNNIAISSNKKVNLEGENGDTSISYVSGNQCIEFTLNGSVIQRMGQIGEQCKANCELSGGLCKSIGFDCKSIGRHLDNTNYFCTSSVSLNCCMPGTKVEP